MFKNIWRIIKTIASIWGENMLGYLSLDIICSSKLTVFLELRSRKTVRLSEHIMSADKYPRIYTEFINGGRAEKNWYWGMETRRFRINNFCVTREQVKIIRVLKLFFAQRGSRFFLGRFWDCWVFIGFKGLLWKVVFRVVKQKVELHGHGTKKRLCL